MFRILFSQCLLTENRKMKQQNPNLHISITTALLQATNITTRRLRRTTDTEAQAVITDTDQKKQTIKQMENRTENTTTEAQEVITDADLRKTKNRAQTLIIPAINQKTAKEVITDTDLRKTKNKAQTLIIHAINQKTAKEAIVEAVQRRNKHKMRFFQAERSRHQPIKS